MITGQMKVRFPSEGALRAETGRISGMKFGVGYYTAQDLGTNDDNPTKVNTRLGRDLEALGEAYVNLSGFNTDFTLPYLTLANKVGAALWNHNLQAAAAPLIHIVD